MSRPAFVLPVLAIFLVPPFAFALTPLPPAARERAVFAVLDDFHDAARRADESRYFAHFTDDGVFLGTDATERWTLPEFRRWAHPFFAKGKAWNFRPRPDDRHLIFESDGSRVFFDELLDNDSYGLCRGTGVLRKVGGKWKLVAYSLALTVPNDVADDVVARIRRGTAPPTR